MWYYNNESQDIFDRCISASSIVIKFLFKAAIYSPLILTSYMISEMILQKEDHSLAWIGLISLFSVFLYLLLYFLKGVLIRLHSAGNFLWMLLLLLCTCFACILPIWLCFDTIRGAMQELSKNSSEALTWIASVSFGLLIYSRYHFLTNMAPAFAFPSYRAGIDTTLFLLKNSSKLNPTRSKQLF